MNTGDLFGNGSNTDVNSTTNLKEVLHALLQNPDQKKYSDVQCEQNTIVVDNNQSLVDAGKALVQCMAKRDKAGDTQPQGSRSTDNVSSKAEAKICQKVELKFEDKENAVVMKAFNTMEPACFKTYVNSLVLDSYATMAGYLGKLNSVLTDDPNKKYVADILTCTKAISDVVTASILLLNARKDTDLDMINGTGKLDLVGGTDRNGDGALDAFNLSCIMDHWLVFPFGLQKDMDVDAIIGNFVFKKYIDNNNTPVSKEDAKTKTKEMLKTCRRGFFNDDVSEHDKVKDAVDAFLEMAYGSGKTPPKDQPPNILKDPLKSLYEEFKKCQRGILTAVQTNFSDQLKKAEPDTFDVHTIFSVTSTLTKLAKDVSADTDAGLTNFMEDMITPKNNDKYKNRTNIVSKTLGSLRAFWCNNFSENCSPSSP